MPQVAFAQPHGCADAKEAPDFSYRALPHLRAPQLRGYGTALVIIITGKLLT